MTNLAALPGRRLIRLEGEGRASFLQGLVSNDVAQAVEGRAVWAAFLTPQGKYLADFFIIGHEDALFLDCEAGQLDMLLARLSRYKLRERVTLRPAPELLVHAAWGAEPPAAGTVESSTEAIIAVDPRLPAAGWRVLTDAPLETTASEADWDRHRIRLGLPDGTRDLEPEKTVLLEAGFDELQGVSWQKGCYLGQELTARTKYRGLIKRRLVPVDVEGTLPPPGSPVFHAGVEVGTMRSGIDQMGMAVLRLSALGGRLDCAGAVLVPRIPAWMRVPEPAS